MESEDRELGRRRMCDSNSYVVRQRLLKLKETFSIVDGQGVARYRIDSPIRSLGRRLVMRSETGEELMQIRHRLFKSSATYEIRSRDLIVGTVMRSYDVFRNGQVSVDVPADPGLALSFAEPDCDFAFTRAGEVVAKVANLSFERTKTYQVEIARAEDQTPILALVVGIDRIRCDHTRVAGIPGLRGGAGGG